MSGQSPIRFRFCWGGGEQKVCSPVAWSPTGNQPTACTLALWWLKFGPMEGMGGGGVAGLRRADMYGSGVRHVGNGVVAGVAGGETQLPASPKG